MNAILAVLEKQKAQNIVFYTSAFGASEMLDVMEKKREREAEKVYMHLIQLARIEMTRTIVRNAHGERIMRRHPSYMYSPRPLN